MGYCISVRDVNFKIKETNKLPAFVAVKALQGKETIKDASGRHFSWVDAVVFFSANTLEEVLEEWRWHPTINPSTGDITHLNFTGEKMGDDDILFKTLAPFVEADSEMTFYGEDGESWKYKFDGKTMKVAKMKCVWEEE